MSTIYYDLNIVEFSAQLLLKIFTDLFPITIIELPTFDNHLKRKVFTRYKEFIYQLFIYAN